MLSDDLAKRFDAHAETCPVCSARGPSLCAVGEPLFLEWAGECIAEQERQAFYRPPAPVCPRKRGAA